MENQNKNLGGAQERTAPGESVAKRLAELKNQQTAGNGTRRGVCMVIEQTPPAGDNTTIMIHMVRQMSVDEREPSAYFTSTLSNVQLCNRLIAAATGVSLEKISAGQISEEEWALIDKRLPRIMEAPLYIDDTPETTLADLRQKIRGLVDKHGVRLIVADHIRISDITNRHLVLSALRTVADELAVAIIAIED